jgi:hypothetical protein
MPVSQVNSMLKFEFPNGKVRFLELAKVEGYDWGVLRVLDENGIEANTADIKMEGDALGLQRHNVGGASADLVLDENGLWTTGIV